MRKSKRLFVRPARSDEKKSRSPYWTWIYKHSRLNDNGEYVEPAESNPDILSDEDVIWQSESDIDRYNLKKKILLRSALQRALRKLTKTDKDLVTLISQGCYNFSELAEKLGVSRGFIRYRLQKIQELSAKMLETSTINDSSTDE